MIRLIVAAIVIIAILAIGVPAAAADVNTGVKVLSGASAAPLVKVKWETTDGTATGESGDPSHLTIGTQVMPNVGFQAQTNVWFWAVVTDPMGKDNIGSVYADVYYPSGTVGVDVDPGPANAQKFEVKLDLYSGGDSAAGLAAYNQAAALGIPPAASSIIRINSATPTMNYPPVTPPVLTQNGDIQYELAEGLAKLYVGQWWFDNCELAGYYMVTINAVNKQGIVGNWSNGLQWMAKTAAGYDFGGFEYGDVSLGVHKVVGGDRIWDLPITGIAGQPRSSGGPTVTNKASIENWGNTYLRMTIKQDDMGFGQNVSPAGWNVHFDARLGADPNAYVNYDPLILKSTLANLALATPATEVPQILRLCAIEKVDLSITIDKDLTPATPKSGFMVLGANVATGPPTDGTVYTYSGNPPTPAPVPTATH